jgi:polyhydroxyalkanoate synthesis repressor PhaR
MTHRVIVRSMAQADSGARVVRRYGNRKLYDTHSRRYVTLEGLRRLVASGHEVEVVDQGTGEDLTAVVLAQLILEGVRERTARIPRQVLSALIRLGAGTAATAAEWPPAQAAARAGQEAEKIARRVVGRLTLEEAAALRQEIAHALQRAMAEAQRGLQARVAALVKQLEAHVAGQPAIAAVGAWLAGRTGEKTKTRRTSWRKATGRPQPARPRAPRRPRAKPPRPPAPRRPPSSATAGRPRSRPFPRRKRRSASRSRR